MREKIPLKKSNIVLPSLNITICYKPSNRNFNRALFARLADGNIFALIHRRRVLRREVSYACALSIANAKVARILREVQ